MQVVKERPLMLSSELGKREWEEKKIFQVEKIRDQD